MSHCGKKAYHEYTLSREQGKTLTVKEGNTQTNKHAKTYDINTYREEILVSPDQQHSTFL